MCVLNSIVSFSQGTWAAIHTHLQWYTAGANEVEMLIYCEFKQNSTSRRSVRLLTFLVDFRGLGLGFFCAVTSVENLITKKIYAQFSSLFNSVRDSEINAQNVIHSFLFSVKKNICKS